MSGLLEFVTPEGRGLRWRWPDEATASQYCSDIRRSDEAPVTGDYYRHYRIDVNAVHVDCRWNAEVRIRRILSQDKPHVETVTCFKLTAEHPERAGEVWAKRWIDLKAKESIGP